MRTYVGMVQATAIALIVVFGACHSHVKADPITPLSYNATSLPDIYSANFDQSGNVIAQRTDTLAETYVTSGPNAGHLQVFSTTFGQGSVIYQVANPPTFNPGPLPGEQASTVVAGNSSGQEIGVSFPIGNGGELGQHGYLYTGGPLISLPGFDGTLNSNPRAINQVGQVVGDAPAPGTVSNAFLYSAGKMIDLGTPGVNSMALNLNNLGQVVGFTTVGNTDHAFVYENGKMYDLNNLLASQAPGLVITNAIAINDIGQIIVEADGPNAQYSGIYLLTPSNLPVPPPPIPEPSTLAFFSVAIIATVIGKMIKRSCQNQTGSRKVHRISGR